MKTANLHWRQLRPSPLNKLVRREIDEAEIEALAASIQAEGQLQPVTVCPTPGGETPFEVILGERRWRAIRSLGERAPLVSCIIKPIHDEVNRLVMMGAENLRRQDLNPLEEARYYRALEERGLDAGQIAGRVGSRREHIRKRLDLLDLAPLVQSDIEAGRLPLLAAGELARLEPDLQAEVARKVRGQKVETIKRVVQKILAAQNGAGHKANGRGPKRSGTGPQQNGASVAIQPPEMADLAQTVSRLTGLLLGWIEQDGRLLAELADAASAVDLNLAERGFDRAAEIRMLLEKHVGERGSRGVEV